MKHLYISLLFCILTNLCPAQKQYQVKLYQNTDVFRPSYSNSDFQTSQNSYQINVSRISIAISLSEKNKPTHEIEFFVPEISNSIYKIKFPLNYKFQESDRFESIVSSYSFRYEVKKEWNSLSKKWSYEIGMGINPYYTKAERIPNNENTYYASDKIFGASLNLTPGIIYIISKHFTINLSIPVKLYDLRKEITNIKNPAIPVRQQKFKEYNHVFFESAYTLRLGIGYKF